MILMVVLLGLSTRYFNGPIFVTMYVGDGLWALMVFLIIGFLFKDKSTLYISLLALIFCYGIELSQLYQGVWISNLRATTLGGLVLGYGFLWKDILSYTVGVALGAMMEKFILKIGKSRRY